MSFSSRAEHYRPKRWVDIRGLLAIEVLSPSTRAPTGTTRRRRYQRAGVPEYWVVDPEARRVEVYRPPLNPRQPEIADATLVWQPVPDGPVLTFPVADLFETPLT